MVSKQAIYCKLHIHNIYIMINNEIRILEYLRKIYTNNVSEYTLDDLCLDIGF